MKINPLADLWIYCSPKKSMIFLYLFLPFEMHININVQFYDRVSRETVENRQVFTLKILGLQPS